MAQGSWRSVPPTEEWKEAADHLSPGPIVICTWSFKKPQSYKKYEETKDCKTRDKDEKI